MLDSLHIENMAVIESLDVDFTKGLSVITGETGSGKSVMLDSLAFLLGAKPPRELLRTGAGEGMVSAVFSDVGKECNAYLEQAGFAIGDELLLQRTLMRDGKSKCRLNGRAVPQAMLRELASYLVSIHAQNDNQRLLQPQTQQRILDTTAELDETLVQYQAQYRAYCETNEKIEQLKKDSAEALRIGDVLRYQIKEIDAARLKPDEEPLLQQQRARLQNAERIAKQAEFTYRVLYGSEKGSAALILERAAQAMQQLSHVLPEVEEMAKRLGEMRYEVEDIANAARDLLEDTEGDPTAALNRVEGRLDTITKMRRKYGEDIEAVLHFRKEAAERLSRMENFEGELQELEKCRLLQKAELERLSVLLHDTRVAAAQKLSRDVSAELVFLDMPGVRFCVTVESTGQFGPTGCDSVAFCIATTPKDPFLPLARIASGGELARIMLAVKSVLNDRDGVQCAVFDEVDTGISGKTSRKIGIKLAQIACRTQVLCVTHSAQIASLATTHFKITKTLGEDGASSSVAVLDDEGRVAEVARILGGLSLTEAQVQAARDMIAEGRGSV